MIVLTDPERFPDTLAFANRTPRGSVLVFRHFGLTGAAREAESLRRIADQRDLVFLIAADPRLARQVGADGVHWPERLLGDARRHHPDGMIFTASAHSAIAARRAASLGASAVLLSPVFSTKSPGSGRALGLWTASAIARRTAAPVYALGGVGPQAAKRLAGLGFSGVATVSGIQV